MAKKTTDGTLPTVISIPGGKATFLTDAEIPPRRERELDVLYAQLNLRKIKAIRDASKVLKEDGSVADENAALTGPDTTLTEDEARLMFKAAEVTAWAYLKSWTLQITTTTDEGSMSVPRPVPAEPDDYLDLPKPIYKALTDHAAKIVAQNLKDEFSAAAAGDPESPTEA